MPMLNSIKRRLVEHLATLVNELHVGSILVEGVLNSSHVFSKAIQEVYLQYKDANTGEFIPVYRADIHSLTKSAENEVRFSFILEVS